MSELVIDASVALKWFLPEADTGTALELRDGHVAGRLRLLAPELLLLEVANALRWKRGYDREMTEQALARLANLGLTIVPVDNTLLGDAIRLAYATGSTIYDALYLALAQGRGCRVVTTDSRLLERLAGAEVTISVVALREWRAR